MKITFLILLLYINYSHAASSKSATQTAPKLKKGEYSLRFNETYEIFKTITFENLELSQNCFKAAKPKCSAYSISLEKLSPVKLKHPEANNYAAHNCVNAGGKNLIALDHENNEYNFCRFNDGSMVTSWSMYYKTNPKQLVK